MNDVFLFVCFIWLCSLDFQQNRTCEIVNVFLDFGEYESKSKSKSRFYQIQLIFIYLFFTEIRIYIVLLLLLLFVGNSFTQNLSFKSFYYKCFNRVFFSIIL
jgi:hypothetical protein